MHILVIGSGLMGTTTAWFLRRYGADVTVVDRAEAAAMETSFANAGMLTPSMADPWNAPGVVWKLLRWLGQEDAPLLLRAREIPRLAPWGIRFLWNSRRPRFERNMLRNLALASFSLRVLQELREELALAYDQRTVGTLKVFRERRALDAARATADQLATHGVIHRSLDRDGVVALEPSLAPVAEKLAGGIHHPDDESGDAHLFCRTLADAARAAGVAFRFAVTVAGFRPDKDRIRSALTSSGELDADAFVVAAGSYTPRLLSGLGIRLPVRPVKGYSITVPCGDWEQRPMRPVTDDTLHAAVTPLGDRIRVAGTAEFAGLDTTVGAARIGNLKRLLREIYPDFAAGLKDETDIQPWSGLRPMSADGVPILGATPIDNLFVNTGHGHLGWTMAAGSGKAVAALIADGDVELPLADLPTQSILRATSRPKTGQPNAWNEVSPGAPCRFHLCAAAFIGCGAVS